ncbi:MAG: histidine kinase [Flavobacteriales bacterium]|nr:histidine kinase [Flavobacteriales bacterium]
MYFGIDAHTAWTDSLLNNALLAFACFDITLILRYHRSSGKSWYMPLLWCVGLAAASLVAIHYIAGYLYGNTPADALFEHTVPLRFAFFFVVIGAFMLLDRLLHYQRAQDESNERRLNLEKLGKEAELSSLRQQLQPHFLFNTLNSVSSLISIQPEEARSMIHKLSDFLRGTVKKNDGQFVDLASELNQLNLYLDIEKVRFGHRLNTEAEQDEAALPMMLPPLLLQPLVENAIKFGLYDTVGTVTIRITARAEKGYLVITIRNPFDAETARPRQGTGFGLTSVQRRLYLLFARNDLLQTRADKDTFTVTVKIPQRP